MIVPTSESTLRQRWRAFLRITFDDDQFSPEAPGESWLQMQLLMNSKDLNAAIADPAARTLKTALQQKTPEQIADRLYLAVLTRHPTAREKERIEDEIRRERQRSQDGSLLPVWQDLLWALLNSGEFVVQH